ncbi:MAG TPA: cation-transporting P-type ATPase [Acidimicrobiia bacterium]|nr:cation-transporting P-type ATPase [Acidimicrobiia bacterium]
MSVTAGQSPTAASEAVGWHGLSAQEVADKLGTNLDTGLSASDAAERLQRYGPNALQKEVPPSRWVIMGQQVRDPMNIMLLAVAIVSVLIREHSTAVLVGLLVWVNVAMGTRQELKARASVEALAEMQIPQARVMRDGQLTAVPATDVVPGDLVAVESGDIVVADGRIVRATNMETQEAALTGESAPIPKGAETVAADAALGDRIDMTFQNTSVTRGTANFVVTATGMETEVGKIAGLLQSVQRTRSPLQQQLDGLTKWLGVVAWTALAIVVVAGMIRGLEFSDLLLLGTAMAISAIPTGMPTFVQGMLSYGARKLAEARAIVRNLSDVETLGATSAINTDKTGTLTLNQMTATKLFYSGEWFNIEGGGYSKQGAILGSAGQDIPDFQPLALGCVLASDATVTDEGEAIGDPTEAALIVLAAKVGVDAGITRRQYPRLADVPFDSEYKYMATFHRHTRDGEERIVEIVKGAPDVLLDLSTHAYWNGEQVDVATVRDDILRANRELSEAGLRVLALGFRRMTPDQAPAIEKDPQGEVRDLVFGALVGIIDPLRTEAKDAVKIALAAGIDVRMITGDHTITARAIADQLGLGEGVLTGPEFAALSDDEIKDRLPQLHVFGRVSPEDKLRLASLMQEQGLVVAMTGDAVNDAAALKKADIGVAMGSGSEVSKQAAKMVLTDDNFATLVHAVELGRDIYHKVTAYIRYQMSQLFGLVSLFLIAAVFGINDGVALQPMQAIFLNFFVAIFPVIAIMTDVTDPTVMRDKPRDPKVAIFNKTTGPRWILYGLVLGVMSMIPLVWGPDEPSIDNASVAMTMAFAVMGASTILSGFVMRHDREMAFANMTLKFAGTLGIGALVVIFATEFRFLQQWLLTTSLTGPQWAAVLGLALVMPIVVGADKTIQRMRARR